MAGARDALVELVRPELARPAPPAAAALARAIVERHGACVAAVLFYGSCLRKATHEGVLDFYVVVDDYRSTYGAGWLAFANACLPPNVFYLETRAALAPGEEPVDVRCKYAVLSAAAFERLAGERALHPYIWARFAQPALIAWARDARARERATAAVAEAVRTFALRMAPLMPAAAGSPRLQRFSLAAFWQQAFARTYSTEFRSESPETIRSHWEAAPERYERAAHAAFASLAEDGRIARFTAFAGAVEVESRPAARRAARLRWQAMRPVCKALAALRLLKTATTFGDWLPYALWKVERHSGVRTELTERQRRHPLLFGWPVIFRLLGRRALR
ncbi:MAG: hypothetical protein KC560_09905 [Myxococcales bacterium]|nr:hypothetical protein [Myxococcales bacterium]